MKELKEIFQGLNEILSKKLKIKIGAILVCALCFLIFGFKGNGEVTYYGSNYRAGSVFRPASYTSYGMFSSIEKEINALVAEKRKGSVAVVLTSVCVAAGFGFSLWKDDEFKDILIEIRNTEV